MSGLDQTPGALLRNRAASTGALATVPGREDNRPHAEQYPDAASAHRAAWGSMRWSYQATNPVTREVTTQYADNAGVVARMTQLAEEGAPIGWCDFPNLGRPPEELAPLYATAIAQMAEVGTVSPNGPDDNFVSMMTKRQALLEEWDYARTRAREG